MRKTEHPVTDSNLLRTFVEIAVCRNLTVAASRLGRSQSAISVQLGKLETELGTSLFLRDGKGMSLSTHGEKLLPVARQALKELANVRSLFEAPLKGKIRVGIPDDFDEGVLERTLADFTQSHPGVDVSATSGCTATFPDAVRKGDLDIAVCSGIEDVPGDVFHRQQPVWVASKTLNLSPDETVPLAVINHGCTMGELPKVTLEQSGISYNVAFECSGMMGLKAAIRAGFGVGILFENNVESSMRVLSRKDGFPSLPTFMRSIIIGQTAPQDLASAMAKAIVRSI